MAEEQILLKHFRCLPPAQQQQLLEFAEFLLKQHGQRAVEPPPAPADIPRPGQESVVGAIKRLSATYPMLDRSKMLHETSGLMTQHVMQGRDAVEVIDELEILFQRHFSKQFPPN
jgi:hypothetical protein